MCIYIYSLPCRWSKDTIVVMDEVLITPPYSVDNCKANSSSGASLARVKKVVSTIIYILPRHMNLFF